MYEDKDTWSGDGYRQVWLGDWRKYIENKFRQVVEIVKALISKGKIERK
jgi:hypothetical protein